jgi:hypothetical protein
LQPGRFMAAFYVLRPTVPPVPEQIAIRTPPMPITVLFPPSRSPGSKVEKIVCSVWASQSDFCSGRIHFYHQERVHSEGRFLTPSDEKWREAIQKNIYDINVIFRSYYSPYINIYCIPEVKESSPFPQFPTTANTKPACPGPSLSDASLSAKMMFCHCWAPLFPKFVVQIL